MTTKTATTVAAELSKKLEALGLSLAVLTGPIGTVKDSWPSIGYTLELSYQGRRVWTGDYSLGVGYVQIPKAGKHEQEYRQFARLDLDREEESMLITLQRNPHPTWKNPATALPIQAAVCAKLAKAQKVKPILADVLHSLMLDGGPHFNHENFEDWCGNFGYDSDSRKAEATYNICRETGRALAQGIPARTLGKVRKLLQDY